MARKRKRAKGKPPRSKAPSASGLRVRSARPLVIVLASVALVAALALVWRARRPEVHREPGLNVLLVTVDTLRADALGTYGPPGAPSATPWIDRLARAGVRFEHAYAHNVVTLPSHANILSGRLPTDHGVRDNSGFRFPDGLATLATLLKEQGYRTGAFVSAFPLDSQFGLARGFDVYEDSFVNVDTNPAFLVQERRGAATVSLARQWIESGSEPWFAWVHLFEPHFPYEPPPSSATAFPNQPYLGEVATTDAALASLLGPIVAAGKEGDTLVVFTADHGEALGEHGEQTHGLFAYEATLHVPLILFAPRILSPATVDETVGHVDLLPTILDAIGTTSPDGLPGRSLLPLANGQDIPAGPVYFESLSAALNRGWAPLRGVVQDRLKLVDLPIPELYDVAEDPTESRNLASSQPDTVEEMRSILRDFPSLGGPIRRTEESDETRARLEALGYVTSDSSPLEESYTEADDPKRLVGLDGMLHEVAGLHARGELDEAIALCREMLRQRPDMSLGLGRLAFLLREKGDLDGAVEAMRRAFALDTSDMDTLAVLAAYLNEAGRESETLELLEPWVEGDEPDLDVLIAHGVALARSGRHADALEAFRRARELDPSSAMVLANMATVDMMRGDDDSARDALQRALELNPSLARAHNSLGVIAAREGKADEAIEHWKRAVELDPGEFDTLFNLGVTLMERGRASEARPYLERFVKAAPRALYADDIDRMKSWLQSQDTTSR